MNALLAALLLAAAPPAPAQKAKELAAQKAWEELYLAFSSGEAAGVPEAQRRTISGALHKGCEALLAEDPVMAYSLGERAVVYEASAPALKCLARSARKTDQRAAAEAALRKGMTGHPKDGAFGLELGKLLMEEQDAAGAMAVLELVPKRSREAAEAKRLMQQARSQLTQEGSARLEAGRIERQLQGTRSAAGPAQEAEAVPALALNSSVDTRPTTLSYQSSIDEHGIRTRANSRFTIRYFNNNRDFTERADYEGTIVETLEDAYHITRQLLGDVREKPVQVLLYTRQEYRNAFGAKMETLTAGVYSDDDDSISINAAAKVTPHTKATIVHEYVHAAMDEVCNDMGALLPSWFHEGVAEYVSWRYSKRDGPEEWVVADLQSAARADALPSLQTLPRNTLINSPRPYLVYAVAGLAVREMVRQSGLSRLVPLMKDVCSRQLTFDKALLEHFGKSVGDLDREVRQALPSK